MDQDICKYCGNTEFWFDRTFSLDSEGKKQYGPYFRCTKCGKSEEEEKDTGFDIESIY